MSIMISPYLIFDGNCEEVFNFYKSVFGGEFTYFSRFKEMPSEEKIPEELSNKILHVELPIGQNAVLMGSDNGDCSFKLIKGNNISVFVDPETIEKADNIFAKLSEGGKVEMPMSKTFWGAYFGSFTDKYNINWMIHTALKDK